MNDWSDDGDPYDDEPYGEDWHDGDETETVSCPSCGADVYEDAPACPVCGEYVTAVRSPLAGMPRWFAVLGVLGTLLVIVTLLGI